MAEHQYQVVVIGGGPGGYVAANHAASLGLKTACVEKRKTYGGTCLNVGCIPSKTLLNSSEVYAWMRDHGKEIGIVPNDLAYDIGEISSHKDTVVASLVNSVAAGMKAKGVQLIEGSASFLDEHTIKVGDQEITSDYFILATGSEPVPLPFAPFDEKIILSSTGALFLPEVPKRMIVVGAGIIGVEIASVYNRLGTEVVIIEMLDHICPGVDKALARNLLQSLTKQGLEFHLQSKVKSIKANGAVKVQYEQEEQTHEAVADVALICVGRRPYSQGLDLDKIGIKVDSKGFVTVDNQFRSSKSHIFAIGDLTVGPGLAHRASEEGAAVAEIIAGKHPKVNYLAIPSVIYTFPEVASVGLTEQQAQESGLEVVIGTNFFRGNARGRAAAHLEGFVKVLGDKKTKKLLGMHIIGAHASELIAVGALAMQTFATLEDLAYTPFAHPTLSEAIKEAAQQALSK